MQSLRSKRRPTLLDSLLLIVIVLILLFGLVILRGAPYVPTLKVQVDDVLDLLDLQAGQRMLELGSGDGRLLGAAAKRGIYAVGYELNPLLVAWTKIRYWKYRSHISVEWGDFWLKEWPESEGMYVFLLQKYMKKLDNKIVHYANKKHYKLVSNGFVVEGRQPAAERKSLRLYLYN